MRPGGGGGGHPPARGSGAGAGARSGARAGAAPGLPERRGVPGGGGSRYTRGTGWESEVRERIRSPPGLALGVPQPVEKLQQAAGPAAEPWEISEGAGKKNRRSKSVVCVTLTSARTRNNRGQQRSGCGSRCLPARRSSMRRRAGAVGTPAVRPSSSRIPPGSAAQCRCGGPCYYFCRFCRDCKSLRCAFLRRKQGPT